MQNNNLIVDVRCTSCRAGSQVEITEKTYGPGWLYKPTPVQYCPHCGSKLDTGETKIIQQDKNWRIIWQEERNAEKQMQNDIEF